MSGLWAPPEVWTIAVVTLAVIAGVIQLLVRRRAAARDVRGPIWRLAVLVALQIAAGVLLHLVLFPPNVLTRTGGLVVATAGAPAGIALQAGEVLVALPEAGAIEGATRVPDLATALRRYPGAATIRLEGHGLTPRDQAPIPRSVRFDPPPRPRGIIDLTFPGPVAPGGGFVVGGRIGTLPQGIVELVDPAGAVADRTSVAAGQRFVLAAHTRAPGLALFTVRLREVATGRTGAVVEQVTAPVEARVQAPPRVLVLAGAPDAETKYLRRWAEDAGIDLDLRAELGGGVRLVDAPTTLSGATFAATDLVVIDERRWETLGAGERVALTAAVDSGLGLMLRPTGPLPESVRRDWTALGLPLTGGTDDRPLRLAPTRIDTLSEDVAEPDALPELAARDLAVQGRSAIALLRDTDGAAFATWRARGRGRVGVWTLTDSYALVLTGRPDRYGELWSEVFSVLGRPGGESRAWVNGFPRAGERVAICGLVGAARVLEPGGAARSLRIDPATGAESCGAYWPDEEGWRVVVDGQGRETALYIHPASAAPSLIAATSRQATLALAAAPASRSRAPPPGRAPGSPWPWFALLLSTLALLWWLERNGPTLRFAAQPKRENRVGA